MVIETTCEIVSIAADAVLAAPVTCDSLLGRLPGRLMPSFQMVTPTPDVDDPTTVAHLPDLVGIEFIFLERNGLVQSTDDDFTRDGLDITLVQPLITGETLRALIATWGLP